MPITSRREGDILVITVDQPPVNGLGHAVRMELLACLQRAMTDQATRAIVVTGRKGCFSAGADISEFGTPMATTSPTLTEIVAALDASPKPVVAAIDGTCFGGGLELVLAMHHRVATESSRLALPEVTLGIIPGAGGTQRLPRAIGCASAADLITTGSPRTAAELAAIPGQALLDRVTEQDVVSEAVALAAEVADNRPPARLRDRAVPSPVDQEQFEALKESLSARHRGLEAPLIALDLVFNAGRMPFDEAIAEERRSFLRLVAGPQSAGMRHAFFAERLARKVTGLQTETPVRPVESVMVVGAGTMGTGIAMSFLNAGLPVTLVDNTEEGLERGRAAVAATYASQVRKGRLATSVEAARLGLLVTSTDPKAGAHSDLVVEAVFEDWDVKTALFTQLATTMKPGAILATNTSTLDVDRLAAATGRPEDVVGLHFFSPAHIMKLLEVVRGARTAPDVLATAMGLAARIGKTPVVAGVCDGFIGNRMLARYREAAGRMLLAGLEPQDIDQAIESFGFAMGPYRMGDLAGNDIGWAVRKRRYNEHPDSPRDEIADALCELGRFGQKTGAGWYEYRLDSRDPIPSPAVAEILAGFRPKAPDHQRPDPEQIAERLVFALVDEGARILDEGIAQRASDIDVVYVSGYGFPRYRGGPMYYADQVGLDRVLEVLIKHNPEGWQPAPLLVRLAKDGSTFN